MQATKMSFNPLKLSLRTRYNPPGSMEKNQEEISQVIEKGKFVCFTSTFRSDSLF